MTGLVGDFNRCDKDGLACAAGCRIGQDSLQCRKRRDHRFPVRAVSSRGLQRGVDGFVNCTPFGLGRRSKNGFGRIPAGFETADAYCCGRKLVICRQSLHLGHDDRELRQVSDRAWGGGRAEPDSHLKPEEQSNGKQDRDDGEHSLPHVFDLARPQGSSHAFSRRARCESRIKQGVKRRRAAKGVAGQDGVVVALAVMARALRTRSVADFSCPQAAMISSPRGVRIGLA